MPSPRRLYFSRDAVGWSLSGKYSGCRSCWFNPDRATRNTAMSNLDP